MSLDESAEQVLRRMDSLAALHPAGPIDAYANRLLVIGPDSETDPESLERFRLDESGLARLEELVGEGLFDVLILGIISCVNYQ